MDPQEEQQMYCFGSIMRDIKELRKWDFVDDDVVNAFEERFATPYQYSQKQSNSLRPPPLPTRTPSPIQERQAPPKTWGVKPASPPAPESGTTRLAFVNADTGKETQVILDNKKAMDFGKKAFETGAAQNLAKGMQVNKNGQITIKPQAAFSAGSKMTAGGENQDAVGVVKKVEPAPVATPTPFYSSAGFLPPPQLGGPPPSAFIPPPGFIPSLPKPLERQDSKPIPAPKPLERQDNRPTTAPKPLERQDGAKFNPVADRQCSTKSPSNPIALAGLKMAESFQSKPPPPLPTKPKKMLAIADFVAEHPADLSFKKGDVITVTKSIDENWGEGVLDGKQGIFPITFVQPL